MFRLLPNVDVSQTKKTLILIHILFHPNCYRVHFLLAIKTKREKLSKFAHKSQTDNDLNSHIRCVVHEFMDDTRKSKLMQFTLCVYLAFNPIGFGFDCAP